MYSDSQLQRIESLLDKLYLTGGGISRHYLLTLQAAKDNGFKVYRNQEGKHRVKEGLHESNTYTE